MVAECPGRPAHYFILESLGHAPKVKGSCYYCGEPTEGFAYWEDLVTANAPGSSIYGAGQGVKVMRERGRENRAKFIPDVLELWGSGLNMSEIGRQIGTSPAMVSRILHEHPEVYGA